MNPSYQYKKNVYLCAVDDEPNHYSLKAEIVASQFKDRTEFLIVDILNDPEHLEYDVLACIRYGQTNPNMIFYITVKNLTPGNWVKNSDGSISEAK